MRPFFSKRFVFTCIHHHLFFQHINPWNTPFNTSVSLEETVRRDSRTPLSTHQSHPSLLTHPPNTPFTSFKTSGQHTFDPFQHICLTTRHGSSLASRHHINPPSPQLPCQQNILAQPRTGVHKPRTTLALSPSNQATRIKSGFRNRCAGWSYSNATDAARGALL